MSDNTPEQRRHYAEWWLWVNQALRGTPSRLRAAALAGMRAQPDGASFGSATASTSQAFQDGIENDTLEDPALRDANLYVRARLGLHLNSEAAHQLAEVTLPKWEPAADISTVMPTRTNTNAMTAAAALGAGIMCAVLPMIDVARFWWTLMPALGLGIVSFVTGSMAIGRIKYSGEGGGRLATTSRTLGCVLALVSLPVDF